MTSDDHLPEIRESREIEPIANPGLPEHRWRPTDVDPNQEKRAERQVATFFGVATLALHRVLHLLLRLPDRRQPGHDRESGRLQPDARRLPRHRIPVHRCRPDPLGAEADGRPRDRRAAPPRVVQRRRPHRHGRHGDDGTRGVRDRPATAAAQLHAGCPGPGRPGPHRDAARPGPAARRQALLHHLGARHARRPRRRRHARSRSPTSRSATWSTASPRPSSTVVPTASLSRASPSRSPSPRARSSCCGWIPTTSSP